MKTCKDCIHYDVCHAVMTMGEIQECVESVCEYFKDNSLVLDLPFPPGGDIYIIDDGVILKLTIAIMHIGFAFNEDTYYECVDSESNEGYWDFKNKDLGKTVFITREEAEQTSKEKHANG